MGEIKVTVQTEDRLRAINNLSIAVRRVAEALLIGTNVTIKDCKIKNNGTAINIDTSENVTETKIERVTEAAE